MLKGLEISVVSKSTVEKSISDFRINSEFYLKKYLKEEEVTKKYNQIELFKIAKIADGDHSKFPSNQKKEIRYLQARDIKDNFLDIVNDTYVSNSYFKNNQRSIIKPESILLSIMGTVGDITITPKEFDPCMCNRALAIVRDIKILSPQYVFSYLLTEFAFDTIERLKNGGVQQRLNLDVLGQIKIPILNDDFQKLIEKIVIKAQDEYFKSKDLYGNAENLLLQELKLEEWQSTIINTNVKSFSDSFQISGRFDSEYYHKKYDALEQKFYQFERIKLKKLVSYPISSGITPKAGGSDYTDKKNGIPFIRAVDIIDGLIDLKDAIYIRKEVHNTILKRTQLKPNDVLLSIAGTVGRAGLFKYHCEANINQAVSILRFDESIIKRNYLIVFFNSKIGKEYVAKFARQGLQTNLNLIEVGNLSIPVIDAIIQKEIDNLVVSSQSSRFTSIELIKIAKEGIEYALEHNEFEAKKRIFDNLEKLDLNFKPEVDAK